MRKVYSTFYRFFSDGRLFFLLIMALFFLLGIFAGTVISAGESEESLKVFYEDIAFSVENGGGKPLSTAISSYFAICFTVVILWISGLFGKLLCLFVCAGVVIFKGVVTGYTTGMFISCLGSKGLLVSVAGVLPQYIFLVPIMFLVTVTAFGRAKSNIDFRTYLVFLIISLCLALAPALSDGYISGSLMELAFKI